MTVALQKHDIAVIGGGIVGSAIAYFLARTGRVGEIAVIEPDPTYEFAATPAANGGIRQLFSLPENIRMAQFGLEFYANFHRELAMEDLPADIGFRRRGYLFVSDGGDHDTMEANHRLQVALGARVDALDTDALRRRFPSVNSSDIALAVHSPDDAWINPHAALMGFRAKARALGVTYVQDRVVDWRTEGAVARDVRLSSGQSLRADCFVLAAGAWSAEIGRMIGLDLPVDPMCRESHYFVTRAEIEPLPFIKAETHLAFGPEGQGFAGGLPDWDQPAGFHLTPQPARFEEVVWPRLAHRVPPLESLKLERSWVGHYARNTFDLNVILGSWQAGAENVFMACGYSGHGIMHAPASGRAIAELILDGGYQSLDLSAFGYGRISAGQPYREKGIV
ncbi:MAG: FAD-binding oxidoreductase [Paracoccaceae bacterium]|nr:FAD-binding oxidoreductase [Paracoccaceae bacterium]